MKSFFLFTFISCFVLHSFSQQAGTFKDIRNGKVYKTIKISKQIWMAENLAFETDSNCWAYDFNQKNIAKFGYLYTWETAQYACPSSWHLPSKSEFETLLSNVGGSGIVAYRALLPKGNSGFEALLGGSFDGVYYEFNNIELQTAFWSSSVLDEYTGMCIYTNSIDGAVIGPSDKIMGFSVRCLKDN